jgi:glycosyltransferase involved in cell wall biosynthesis
MRILVITAGYKPAYVYGGPIRAIALACEGLVAAGAEVTVLTTNAGGAQVLDVPLRQAIRVDGVSVTYYPIRPSPFGASFYYSPELTQAAIRAAAATDLLSVQTVFNHAAFSAFRAAAANRKPYVITPHGQLLPWSLRFKSFKKQAYLRTFGNHYLRRATAIHCTDAMEADALPIKLPHFISPNAIVTEEYGSDPAAGAAFRQQWQIPSESLLLLQLGRLHPVKRPRITLEILAGLPPSTHLVFAGPDEAQLMSLLQVQARAAGMEDRVHFTGMLSAKGTVAALNAADLLVMPSEPDSENFGMAALEALACGTPILTTNHIPVGRMAVAHGGAVAGPDVESFIRVAQELAADRNGLRARGLQGQQWARTTFDYRTIGQALLREYEQLLTR